MNRFVIFLLITGTVWAQTDYDKLVLLNGSINKVEYLGEYLKMNHNLTKVYFKPKTTSKSHPVPINLLHTLQLKDGRVLIYNGFIRKKTLLNSLEYEKLTIEQKSELKRQKIQIFTCFAIILVLIPLMFILGSGSGGGSGGSGKVFLGDGPPI